MAIDTRQASTKTENGHAAESRPKQLSPSDMRQLIPPLGLKEYWYPALEDKKIRNKPVGLKICDCGLTLNGTLSLE